MNTLTLEERERRAIKSMMVKLKNRAKGDDSTLRPFPGFIPGETTTAGYARQFIQTARSYGHMAWGDGKFDHLDLLHHDEHPAPYYTGPEVTAEAVADAAVIDEDML